MQNYQYSEDLFAETRMSFGEHIEELRTYLIRAILGFVLAVIISLVFLGKHVVVFISKPVEEALINYHISYYKDHPEKADAMYNRLTEEIEANSTKDPSEQNPALNALITPQPLKVQLSTTDFHNVLKKTYPDLYKAGGPFANVKPPDNDDKVDITLDIKPMDLSSINQKSSLLAGSRYKLTTLNATEAFMVFIKVSLLTGFVLASPWVFYQVWAFIAAGLYPHEKKFVHQMLPFSIFLFIGGVVLSEVYVIPAALDALLLFNSWMDIEPNFRLSEWLSFAILVPVVFGLCFQTPLVMYFLGRLGVFTTDQFRSKRRIVIFIMCVFAAIISPTIDPVSLMLLWLPMVLLYEVGIFMVQYAVRNPALEEEQEEIYRGE